MSNLQIENWPIEKIIPYEDNPRKNDQAVEKMVAVFREFGFRLPVLALSTGELVDGHLRLKAALSMGMTEVPVVLADGMTQEQIRAFRLMVNRSATWASWDDDLLASELAALLKASFDLTLTGFDQSELDKLLLEGVPSEKDPNAVPETPEEPVVRPGELWILGEHRLLCGDSCDPLHIGRLMDGKLASMIWTDPPYNVDYEGKAGRIKNDKMSPAEFENFLLSVFTQMIGVLQPGGGVYVCHSEAGDGLVFRQMFRRAGFRFAACLVWNKGQAVLSRSDYHWQHEPILYGWKPGAAHKWHGNRKQKTILEANLPAAVQQEDGSWTLLLDGKLYRLTGEDVRIEEISGTVINVSKPSKSNLHPTMKPVELIIPAISNSSRSGGIVYEPFSGSGSVIIACEQLGRRCCAMELDPRFAQVDIVRWQEFTGKQAVREADGKLFDDIV